jgi:hypothetical protein
MTSQGIGNRAVEFIQHFGSNQFEEGPPRSVAFFILHTVVDGLMEAETD